DLTGPADLQLLCPEAEVHFGIESLARARRGRLPASLGLGENPPETGIIEAQALIRKRALYALTPRRGARFVENFLPEKGARLCSSDFSLGVEDDLFDLIAALCFDRYAARTEHKT